MTIKFSIIYALREKYEKGWHWFLLPVFWRLTGLLFSQKCGCAYARPSGAAHIQSWQALGIIQDQVTCSLAPSGTTQMIMFKVLLYLKTLMCTHWLGWYLEMPISSEFLSVVINPDDRDATCGQHQRNPGLGSYQLSRTKVY